MAENQTGTHYESIHRETAGGPRYPCASYTGARCSTGTLRLSSLLHETEVQQRVIPVNNRTGRLLAALFAY